MNYSSVAALHLLHIPEKNYNPRFGKELSYEIFTS